MRRILKLDSEFHPYQIMMAHELSWGPQLQLLGTDLNFKNYKYAMFCVINNEVSDIKLNVAEH